MAKDLIEIVSDTNCLLNILSEPYFYYNDLIYLLDKKAIGSLIKTGASISVNTGGYETEKEYLIDQYKILSPDEASVENVATFLSEVFFCFQYDGGHKAELKKTAAALDQKLRDPRNCAHLMSRRSFKEKYLSFSLKEAQETAIDLQYYSRKSEWSQDEHDEAELLYWFLSPFIQELFFREIDGLKTIHAKARIEERHPLFATDYQLIFPDNQYKKILSPIDEIIIESTKNPSLIYKLPPRDFEKFVAQIWSAFGFEVELTAQTRDGGADLLCISNTLGVPFKIAIEVKRYARDRPVAVELVRSFIGANASLNANKLVYVTSSRFTRDAKKFAMMPSLTNQLELYELPDVIRWANEYIEKKRF